MRIAYVHEWWGAGGGRCVSDLSTAFAKTDHVLVVPTNAEATPDVIWSQLKAFRPEVVHCHSFYGHRGLPYSDLAPLTRVAPTVLTVHDPRPIGSFYDVCWDCSHNRFCVRCPLTTSARRLFPPANTFFRARLKKIVTHFRARSTMRIVAPSRWMLHRIQATELGRFRSCHIPNGVDLTAFRPEAVPHPIRQQLPLGTPIVLHAAHSVGLHAMERKGLADVWTAFQKIVLPRFPHARLAVAGEGAIPNHPAVIALGQLSPSEMPAVFAACDLYVTATRADNLPYTVLEAMACGRPVIGTRIGGVPDMVHDNVNGLLVPASAPNELGRAITDLLADPERCAAFGRAGHGIARRDFGLDLFVQRYRQLYAEVIAGAKS